MNLNCLNYVKNRNVGLTSIANSIRHASAYMDLDLDAYTVNANSDFITVISHRRNMLTFEEFKPTWLNRLLFKPKNDVIDNDILLPPFKTETLADILRSYKVTMTGPNYVVIDTGGGSRVKITRYECA